MLLFMAMAIALPTSEVANVPVLVKVIFALSAAITPSKAPAVTDALVVLSYSLFDTTVPVTVNSLGVMFAVTGFG